MTNPATVVIGGGAAGFFGAIAAAGKNPGAKVLLLEKSPELLAKVTISGGGRCNATHSCFDPQMLTAKYPRGGRELIGAFHRWQPRDQIAWFAERGVKLKAERDGRMFPITDKSATIVNCLLDAAKKAGVEIRTQCGVASAEKRDGGGFRLALTTREQLDCDCLLLATGGNQNSSGHAIAKALGHTITPLVPSLFTFNIADPRLKNLSGISVPDAAVEIPGTKLRQTGPLLITHWGLSGPAILKLSAWGARILADKNYDFELIVNWVQAMDRARLVKHLTSVRSASSGKSIGAFSPVPMPARLWKSLAASAGISESARWGSLSNGAIQAAADAIHSSKFHVTDKSMFKEEFVTCGGVDLREVDFRTMQSNLCPGLFFAGEVLDIDGVTGGFNFQAAWTTGWIAGQSMGQTVEKHH